jgi:dihydropteroate synthase
VYPILLRGRQALLGERTWVMGVLNVTPDSFSDGGRFFKHPAAVHHGLALFEAGADIVDVGGESTRPGGASAVDEAEECRRVVPVIRALRERGAGPLSVDTTKASVARAALDAGADIVNDVSGFSFDPEMAPLVAETGVPAILMHLRGNFSDMHRDPRYGDVVTEVRDELGDRLEECKKAGIEAGQVIVDPGLGFAKSTSHSLEVLRRLTELQELDRPLLVGPSRKRFVGRALARDGADAPVQERLMGTAAAVAASILAGAHIVRVHDVREMAQVARVCDAILAGE